MKINGITYILELKNIKITKKTNGGKQKMSMNDYIIGIIGVIIFLIIFALIINGDGFLHNEYANEKCIELGNDDGGVQNSYWFDDEIRLSCRKINSNGEIIHSYPYVLKEVK